MSPIVMMDFIPFIIFISDSQCVLHWDCVLICLRSELYPRSRLLCLYHHIAVTNYFAIVHYEPCALSDAPRAPEISWVTAVMLRFCQNMDFSLAS